MNDQQKLALLEATLREILRLKKAAAVDPSAISFDDIFDGGKSGREWKSILYKAERLV